MNRPSQRTKNALLIIDAQYDFCSPNGALPVLGADKDCQTLAQFIKNNAQEIDKIFFTLDSHHVNDISHPSFWMDKNGNPPPAHTPISYQDIEDGKWVPRPEFDGRRVREYVRQLESQGEFGHYIWPYHCLIGSKGAALDDTIMEALIYWTTQTGRFYTPHTKGTNPYSEHFGAFRAQIPIQGAEETQLDMSFIKLVESYDNVYFAGQARSHCVATTLKQAMNEATSLAKKFVIMEDCMSNVVVPGGPDFAAMCQPIYDQAKQMGIRSEKSTNIILSAAHHPAMVLFSNGITPPTLD